MAHILFIDLHNNLSLAHLPSLFLSIDVKSSVLAFKGRVLLYSSAASNRYQFPENALRGPIKLIANTLSRVIHETKPDFILTSDEILIRNLLKLRHLLRSQKGPLRNIQQDVLSLLEKSLPTSDQVYSRENNITLAAKAGFPIPKYAAANSWETLKTQRVDFPTYLKLSFEGAGIGVAFVQSRETLDKAASRLERECMQPNEQYPILLQQPVIGQELTVSFSAFKGNLLSYDVYRPVAKRHKNGPASVIETLYRPNWESPLRSLVQHLGYSGFGGLDVFEQEGTALPTVIEVNLRPTHSLQTTLQTGSQVLSSFADQLTGRRDLPKTSHPELKQVVALFPDEYVRDPDSPYLNKGPVAIPWNDRQLSGYLMRLANLNGKQKD